MRVFAITYYVSYETGGLTSLHATRELAEKELKRLNKIKDGREYEIEEHDLQEK